MLVLSRKLHETIVIDGDIRITVVSIRGNQVRLGITAPRSVKIFRDELYARADQANERAGPQEPGLANGHDADSSIPLVRHYRSRHEP